jgi:hypothetical protein
MIEIFHVSDLHFGKNAHQNRKAKSLLDAISQKFAKHANRYLLVTGDSTQHGRESEYELAAQALSPFKGRVFITPGNHDYGSFSGIKYSVQKALHFDNPFACALRFTHRFFNKNVFVHLLQDQSNHSALMMIGLNSCSKESMDDWARGEIGDNQRNELALILAQCDARTPKLLFLHHIPTRAAFPDFIMTLMDREELTEVLRGSIDVLAFGHQGKMEVGFRDKSRTSRAQSRPMQVRRFENGRKRILALDANGSTAEQSYYSIKWNGKRLNAEVVSVT